jgi:hypothetical protein
MNKTMHTILLSAILMAVSRRLSLFVSFLILIADLVVSFNLSFDRKRSLYRKRGDSLVPAGVAFVATSLHRMTPLFSLEAAQVDAALPDQVNGEHNDDPWKFLEGINATVDESNLLPSSPQLSYHKFITMQDKRVVVTIRYSSGANLKPFFLTVAKKLKSSHPDVIIEKRLLPAIDKEDGEATFEVLVDGKIVVGKGKTRKQKVARVDMSRARSVFVSMQELDLAIARARRRRRPTSPVYGEKDEKATSSDTLPSQE